MNKTLKHLEYSIPMPIDQNTFCQRVDFPMTRIAEGDKVIKMVIPVGLKFSKPLTVDMMDMQSFCRAAAPTSESIALKGVEIVNVPMLSDEFSQKRALLGAIKLVQRSSWVCAATYNASKNATAGLAVFLVVALNWMKRFSAFFARLCVELWLAFFVLALARLAPNLQLVIGVKHDAALARSHFNRFFHKPIISRLGV